MGGRWYVAYPLRTRHVEALMAECGVDVDHSPINRWVSKYSPPLEEAFHRRKRPVWVSWRMDETYVRVKGEWRYLSRAVDTYGQTIDVLLTAHRDTEAALRFLKKAIRRHCQVVEGVTHIRQAGASAQSHPHFRPLAPCPSFQPNSRSDSPSLHGTATLTADGAWGESVGQWVHRPTENAGHAPLT